MVIKIALMSCSSFSGIDRGSESLDELVRLVTNLPDKDHQESYQLDMERCNFDILKGSSGNCHVLLKAAGSGEVGGRAARRSAVPRGKWSLG